MMKKMKWLLAALLIAGTSAVLGVLRPWAETGDPSAGQTLQGVVFSIGWIVWVLLPMVTGWFFLNRNRLPVTRVLLFLFVAGMLLVWGFGAMIAITDASFEGNLGLLFWPALEWIALLVILIVWAIERAVRKQRAKSHAE